MFLTFMDNISEYQNIIEIIKENIQKYHQTYFHTLDSQNNRFSQSDERISYLTFYSKNSFH